jgi:UDP-GlcNAc:undecaprenyl-phosphate GlcNAc-1-phosphate transferase
VHFAAGALLGSAGWRLHWFNSIALDVFMTSVFVAFILNALNLFDGLDGLVAGTSGMAAIGFLWLFAESGDVLGQIVAGGLVGVCFGMLVYNRPPATIFMGDSGSTLVGMVLAFLALNWIRVQPDSHGVASPLILISLPLCDAAVVIFRRIGSGKSPFGGDRLHLYDLLLERGWSAQNITVTSMSVTAAFLFVVWLSERQQYAAQVVVLLIFICVWRISHALSPANSSIKSVRAVRPAAHECPAPNSITE